MKKQIIAVLVSAICVIALSGCGPFKQTKAAIGPTTIKHVAIKDAVVVVPELIKRNYKYRRIEIDQDLGKITATDARRRPPTILCFDRAFTNANVAEIEDFFLRDYYIKDGGVIVHARWKHFSRRMMNQPPPQHAEVGLTGLHGVWYQGN